jgi:predicted dehydrogenase
MLAAVRGGLVGEVRDVEAAFTKLVPFREGAREYDPAVGGSFTELGSYALLPIVKLLGPAHGGLRFERFAGENGVDVYAKAHFAYPGAVATAKTGIGVKSEGQLLVSGTKGYVLARSPWWLFTGFDACFEDPARNERFDAPFLGAGLRYEAQEFARRVAESAAPGAPPKTPPAPGECPAPDMPLSPKESVWLAGVMESFLQQRR